MNLIAKIAGVLFATALITSTAPAQSVPQDTFENVRLGSNFSDFYLNPLLEGDAQTYSLISGDSLLFGVSVFGQVPDILNASFTGSPGLTVTPNSQAYPYLLEAGITSRSR